MRYNDPGSRGGGVVGNPRCMPTYLSAIALRSFSNCASLSLLAWFPRIAAMISAFTLVGVWG